MSNELIPAHTITHRREDLKWDLKPIPEEPRFGYLVHRRSESPVPEIPYYLDEYELFDTGRYFLQVYQKPEGTATWYEFVPRG